MPRPNTFDPSRQITRQDFTDRLGLPASASNATVLAALDSALAAKAARTADDALYASIYTRSA